MIWSRPLVSHALHSGDLPRLRRLSGLIEVSADGITPPTGGDETRIVSISGWRGQPFHPGWQRIHLELKHLCGARKATPEAAAPPAVAKHRSSQQAAPAATRGGIRPQAPRLVLGGGAAVLLVAAAVGAANWVGQDRPGPERRQETSEPRSPAVMGGVGRAQTGTAAEAPKRSATAPPASSAPPSTDPGVEPEPKRAASPPEAGARAAQRRPSSRPKQPPSPQRAAVKKYSLRNSKVMREFCARSGRSTPQCRTFLRSIRDGQAAD